VIAHGFLVIDKDPAMTSHDVVAMGRRALNTRKVGHAGTLDPMATGVLVLGFGNGTRLLQYVTNGDKSYLATVVLGAATITDDHEGEIVSTADISTVTDAAIESELAKMRGTIAQRPSSVSAVKVDGERAHARVRAGEVFELPARIVTISNLEILEIRRVENRIEVDIDVTCSAGTFIRAIARDCGSVLGVGGHLNKLRRTRVAGFGLDRTFSIAALKAQDFTPLTMADVARATFAVRTVSADEATELSFGRALVANVSEDITAAISPADEVLALLQNKEGKALPIAVFAAVN
jgi:tRNA pseudouridine55 synthase